jgi:quercetin dioxygenase-like cupin family protein
MTMVYNWDAVPKEQMNPLLVRQAIHGRTMTVAHLDMAKGCSVAEHSHHNEQITMLQKGKLRFVLSGKEVILNAGEILHIPPNAPHSAEALEDTVAVDLFSPPREDWIRGDDAYLRK